MNRARILLTGALCGVALLGVCATLQEHIMGFPLAPRGYVVPLIGGSLAGLAGGWWCLRLRATIRRLQKSQTQHRELIEKDANLRRQLATLMEQVAESILLLDRDGRITYVNPGFSRCSGYRPEEVIGREFAALGEEGGAPGAFREVWDHYGRESQWHGRLSLTNREGQRYIVEATIGPIRNDAGEITGYVSVQRNVTEMVELERQFRRAQKMEAIGTLAAGIAHDFNNVLTAITGYTELALNFELADGDPARRTLEKVLDAGVRAAGLVNQILTFTRQQEQELHELNLIPIIKESVKLLRASLPATIAVEQEIGTERDLVLGDPSQLHQVIMNLATNAAQAMATGGTLSISLDEEDIAAGTVIAGGLPPGSYLVLRVADTGSGIAPEIMERIFDPYFTTREHENGSGLGLAVVYGIVQGHDGGLDVTSAPGAGTTVAIYLPRREAAAAAGRVKADTASLPRGTEHIMLVDDEEDIIAVGTRMLEHLGYRVSGFRSPTEALEVFGRDPEAVDLLITDLTMPGMTGDGLVERCSRRRPELPVIICTGFDDGTRECRGRTAAVIRKPLSITQLATTVRRVLDGLADG
jgi:PAS domain S-box-containing protein